MSVSGLTDNNDPPTLDGLTILDADAIYINGQEVNLDALVPYTGATQAVDLGIYPLRTTHLAAAGSDVVNKDRLDLSINNVVASIGSNFLSKTTTDNQTVAGAVSFSKGATTADQVPAALGSQVVVGPNYPLSTVSSATVTVSQHFGSITNSGGVYQATTDIASGTPILIGFPITNGKKYRFTVEFLIEDPTYTWYIDAYQSVDGITPVTFGVLGFTLIPANTSAYTTLDYTFDAVTTGNVIFPVTNDASPTISNQAVKWKNLVVYEQGVALAKVTIPSLTADRVAVFDESHRLVSSGINVTKLGYLDNVSSDLQTQINSKASTSYVDSGLAGKLNLSGSNANQDIVLGSFKVQSNATPTASTDYITKAYGDSTYALASALSGYVPYTGATADLNMGSRFVTCSSDPSNNNELTRKSYVDTLIIARIPRSGDTSLIGDFYTSGYWRCAGKMECGGFFSNTNVGVNQSSPQWLIHANITNAWATAGAKAQGIIGVGGGDNNPDYQYIVLPNPAQGDGQISGLYWWSADMLTGRYKNEFRIAWWKETHGGSLGSAYKEGITLYLTDSGGYTNLDYIKLNGKTIVNGNVGIGSDPTGRLDVYSTTTDYTNNVVIRQPWAGVTFDNTQLSGGRRWHVFSGGEGAGIGKGNFGIYDGTANAYRFSIDSNGQAKFHSWFRVENGDISTCVYGPNATWNSYLRVGAATSLFNANTAQIISTNGNLHLDAGYSRDIYIGFYQDLEGYRGLIRHHASQHLFNSGPVNIIGGSRFAVSNNYMRSGSLTIGATDVNYGWGNLWNSNTAGLLLECSDYTEIAVHDAGTRVTSLMAYIGGAGRNDIFIGRDMGWGIPEVTIPFYRAYYSAGIPFFYNTGGAFLGTPGGNTGYLYIGGQSLVTSNNSPVNTVGNGYWYVSVAGVYALTLCGHAPGGSAEYFISLNCHNTNDLNTNGVRQLVACGYAAPECVVSWTGYLSTTDLISFGCYNNYMVTPTRLTISIVLLQRTS